MARVIAVLLIANVLATSLAANVTPIQKVISMMDGMLQKGKAMKHEEEVEFAKSKAWCKDVRTQTTRSISESAEQIQQLSADISKAESDAEVMAGEVQDLDKETDGHEANVKSATAQRTKDRDVFTAVHLDLEESIGALAKAMRVISAKGKDVPQSLLQMQTSNLIDEKAKGILASFLSGPKANAYESQSTGVMDMLEKLKTKFEDQKLTLVKEEMNSKFSHQTLMQQLTDDIQANKKASSSKTAAKASRLEAAAQAKGDKATSETSKATDEKTLSDTNAECNAKSQEFERNQVTRAEEITAVAKAIEIMGGVKGNGARSALLQASAFAQLRSSTRDVPELRMKAVAYLQKQATKLGSRYLSVIAAHAEKDPFGKIKKMVKDLITKLMEEANAEADANGFCTAELATNKQTRDIKSSDVSELSAKSDAETANSAKLSTQIADLSDELSGLQKKQSEATNMRTDEKKTNANVVAEAQEAQGAVTSAIKVLKDFYSSDTALVQNGAEDVMSAPYKGMGSSSGGILGMLDVILSDFARLETQTSEAESQAQRAYDTFMDESAQDVAVKQTEKKHNENNRDRADEKLRGLNKELEMTQGELDSALGYYEKLKAQCLDTGVSYKERKEMREAEIASLQEALKVLAGEDLA